MITAAGYAPKDTVRSTPAPRTVENLIATPNANDTVHLKWNRNGNAPLTSFVIETIGNDSTQWRYVTHTTKTKITLKYFPPGVFAAFRVIAQHGDDLAGPSATDAIYVDAPTARAFSKAALATSASRLKPRVPYNTARLKRLVPLSLLVAISCQSPTPQVQLEVPPKVPTGHDQVLVGTWKSNEIILDLESDGTGKQIKAGGYSRDITWGTKDGELMIRGFATDAWDLTAYRYTLADQGHQIKLQSDQTTQTLERQ